VKEVSISFAMPSVPMKLTAFTNCSKGVSGFPVHYMPTFENFPRFYPRTFCQSDPTSTTNTTNGRKNNNQRRSNT